MPHTFPVEAASRGAEKCAGQVNNLPCVNRLPGNQYLSNNYFAFQVPGSGSTFVKFYVRISDERGDARPDFISTFGVHGAN
jgi:hypothetical protein